MNLCVESFSFQNRHYAFDNCINTITVSTEIENNRKFTKRALKELSSSCFEAYKYRLEDISSLMAKVGKQEYDLINEELIKHIIPYEPLNYSFSITADPSLHFFVRFSGNISLFIETFLDVDDGHDTYILILKHGHPVLEKNSFFDDAIIDVTNFLERELSNRPTFHGPFKHISECQPSLVG